MADDSDIIKKQYYTIGEVAKELDLSTSLIRFWETEFREINPKKNRKGNRVYTPKDIETLKKIQFLLKVKKYTIKGAKEHLRSNNAQIDQEIRLKDSLMKLRSFLLELKESL
ncbi:MAG: MerR family transcriptional regulator [Bacteroidota bacterium]